MEEELRKARRRLLLLVRNEGKDIKEKHSLKKIYKAKKRIKELEASKKINTPEQ